MSTADTAQYYKDYWVGAQRARDERRYYERLYANLASKIVTRPGWKILDVAGGDGQLMRYLGIRQADILDISESGIEAARRAGFNGLRGDIQKSFPVEENTYDAAFLFEVLEHLHTPNVTLMETQRALKPGGVLYVGQPNMRADGVHHVRRYRLGELLGDLVKCGFAVEWTDFVPAYSMRDSILSDIRKNPSALRKLIQCVNLSLSFLPRSLRYRMAKAVPDRFALIFVVKAVKKN